MINSIRRKCLVGTTPKLIVVLLTLVAGPAWSAEKWDMATAYSPKEYITSSYIAFAKKVTKSSGGALQIKVHPSGKLIKGAEIFAAVGSGKIPIGAFFLGAQAKQDPIFGVDTVPFLATDVDQAWELYQVSKNALDYALKERNMKLLFTAVWPPQGLFTKVKLNSISDMNGVRFRAYDDGTTRLANLMGAVPTTIEATDIRQAFASGVAESMISSSVTGVFQQMWDYTEYFYEGNAWFPKSAVVVNFEVWNRLDGITKELLMEAGAEAEKSIWETMVSTNKRAKQTMTHNGIKVIQPSSKLREEFIKIGEIMAGEWAAAAGNRGKRIIDDLNR